MCPTLTLLRQQQCNSCRAGEGEDRSTTVAKLTNSPRLTVLSFSTRWSLQPPEVPVRIAAPAGHYSSICAHLWLWASGATMTTQTVTPELVALGGETSELNFCSQHATMTCIAALLVILQSPIQLWRTSQNSTTICVSPLFWLKFVRALCHTVLCNR